MFPFIGLGYGLVFIILVIVTPKEISCIQAHNVSVVFRTDNCEAKHQLKSFGPLR